MSNRLADLLTPGVVDGGARHVFTTGGCGALAIAIHDATGWPIIAITDSHNVHDGKAGGGSAMHWGVRHPSGRFVDVDGLHDLGDMVEEYADAADDGEAAWGLSTREDAIEWWEEAGSKIPLELAGTFVDPITSSL